MNPGELAGRTGPTRTDTATFFLVGAVSFNVFVSSFPAQYFFEGALCVGAVLAGILFSPSSRLQRLPLSHLTAGLAALAGMIALAAVFGTPVYVYQWLFPAATLMTLALVVPLLVVGAGPTERGQLFNLLLLVIVAGAVYQALSGAASVFGFNRDLPVLFDSRAWSGRAMGNLGQSNLYAHFLTWGAIASIWLGVRRPDRRSAWTFGTIAAFLLLAAAWGMSRTYLGYTLWLILAGGFLRFRVGGELARFGTALIAAGIWGAIATANNGGLAWTSQTTVAALVSPGRSSSLEIRQVLLEKAWWIFSGNPWFGSGWNSFSRLGTELNQIIAARTALDPGPSEHAHNLFAQIGAELGLMGLCALGFLLWHSGKTLLRSASTTRWPAMVLLGVTFLHSLLEYPLWNIPFLTVVVLLVALHESPKTIALLPGQIAGVRVAAALALVAAVVWVTAFLLLSGAALQRTAYPAPVINAARTIPGMDFPADALDLLRIDQAPFGSPRRLAALRRLNAYLPNSLVQAHTLCELGRHGRRDEQAREYAVFVATFPGARKRIDREMRRFRCHLSEPPAAPE